MLKRPITWLIFFTSLSVRLAAWLWVIAKETPVFADETFYLEKAQACQACLQALFSGSLPSDAIRDAVYGYGVWPPLHTFLLALGGICGGLSGTRLILVLLSAGTTLIILKLALQCGLTFRVAAATALFHAFYPECVAFSHYLWSETTFSFFLLLGLVFALASSDALQSGSRGAVYALAAGGLLGCAGLCRATVLPTLFLLSAWWIGPALKPFFNNRCFRLLVPHLLRTGFLFGMFFLVTAPWLITLRMREGEWKPFSTSGGYNFYLGNHPATPEGLGSAWGTFIYQGGASDQIATYLKQQAGPFAVNSGLWVFSRDEACREAAWKEICARPGAAFKRVFLRAGTLFAPDIFLPRHILNLIYRPMPVACATLLLFLGAAAWILFLLGVSVALFRARLAPRLWLLILLSALLASPALATISVSRMRFASTLLLLPVACEGLRALHRFSSCLPGQFRKTGAASLVLASLALCFVFLRLTLEHFVVPSAHYGTLVRAFSRVGLMQPYTFDTLLVRRGPAGPQAVGLNLISVPSVSLIGQPENRQVLFDLSRPNPALQVFVRTEAGEPIRLPWALPRQGQTATTVFVPGAFSCDWLPTGLSDFQVKVQGSNYRKAVWHGPRQ